MESPLSIFRMHWDREPSWEGRRVADPNIGTATRGPSHRFLGSPDVKISAHWGHELGRAALRRRHRLAEAAALRRPAKDRHGKSPVPFGPAHGP
jgi:hypothetical protein